jgi:hypothetical protein
LTFLIFIDKSIKHYSKLRGLIVELFCKMIEAEGGRYILFVRVNTKEEADELFNKYTQVFFKKIDKTIIDTKKFGTEEWPILKEYTKFWNAGIVGILSTKNFNIVVCLPC